MEKFKVIIEIPEKAYERLEKIVKDNKDLDLTEMDMVRDWLGLGEQFYSYVDEIQLKKIKGGAE
jgi:hypothetical protein